MLVYIVHCKCLIEFHIQIHLLHARVWEGFSEAWFADQHVPITPLLLFFYFFILYLAKGIG